MKGGFKVAYSELIKNFDKIRSYIRDFYVYGFKSRNDYAQKSARSYDDERRRIESWLGEYMQFAISDDKKNTFLSIDSRSLSHNPLYKAWKAKSFTDGDITLHFIIFDILYEPEVKKTLKEMIDIIDSDYLSFFESPMTFDESTLRKKLKEYTNEGIIITEKHGREILYSRASHTDITALKDTLDYFSETVSCGVIGSFILDKFDNKDSLFLFKHHYITQTMDSDVLTCLYMAMSNKKSITIDIIGKQGGQSKTVSVVPLKIYISVQSGRQYLLAYSELKNKIYSYRLEYLQNVKECDVCDKYDELRTQLQKMEQHMWGVNCKWNLKNTEHVEFTVYVGDNEGHIVRRLEREKRCGYIEKVDDNHYKFIADVFDTNEMVPWIRTFICRICEMNFSNRTIENQFKADIEKMYQMYEIGGESV